MARSVIDPVTRIEGHLRVEMEVENGVVSDAWVSGGCFRGMELVVKDRTPEDAAHIVQRICGVCPYPTPTLQPLLLKRHTASPFPTMPVSSVTSSRAHSSCTAISCGSTLWLLWTT